MEDPGPLDLGPYLRQQGWRPKPGDPVDRAAFGTEILRMTACARFNLAPEDLLSRSASEASLARFCSYAPDAAWLAREGAAILTRASYFLERNWKKHASDLVLGQLGADFPPSLRQLQREEYGHFICAYFAGALSLLSLYQLGELQRSIFSAIPLIAALDGVYVGETAAAFAPVIDRWLGSGDNGSDATMEKILSHTGAYAGLIPTEPRGKKYAFNSGFIKSEGIFI
jgi:hypothetical protein